ncbi:hypothetical protein FDP41_013208 [Naegleria fowleri]|uniref:Uncharacterized protein n=1 Tax=Naegleria fowleri TaxID=5763 RepID=A0A6A5C5F4_NAEFO|nr:uncharacterized protein FDP41_013208 [Naegleria fowleri]KAF0980725.1 hypothetical protein FDP41_013208 [Naegleria fowleri]CAG4709569.1 unnamed protein product [Naegleria fowleri]
MPSFNREFGHQNLQASSFYHQLKPLQQDDEQLSIPSQQPSLHINQPSFSQHSSSPRINSSFIGSRNNEIPMASDMNKKALSLLFANNTRQSHHNNTERMRNNINNNIISSSASFGGNFESSFSSTQISSSFDGFKPTPYHYHDSANHHSKDWFSLSNNGPINSNSSPFSAQSQQQQDGFPSRYSYHYVQPTTKNTISSTLYSTNSMMHATTGLPPLFELEPHNNKLLPEPTTSTSYSASSSHRHLTNNFGIHPPQNSTNSSILHHSSSPQTPSSSAFSAYNNSTLDHQSAATMLSKRNSLQSFNEVVDFVDEKKKRPKDHSNDSKCSQQQLETKKRKLEEHGKKELEEDDDEGCGEDEEHDVDEDFVNSSEKLLPIRSLAHLVGLSKDEGKTWRYRDVRRALFEKCSKEHTKFIEQNQQHAILRQRLPHKLTLVSFCKRIMLLVFHFIIRDGKEPKFFSKSHVRRDLIEETLEKEASEFFRRINRDVAMKIHALTCTGLSLEQASKSVNSSENVSLSKDLNVPVTTPTTLGSSSSSSPHLNNSSLPSLRDLLKKPHATQRVNQDI